MQSSFWKKSSRTRQGLGVGLGATLAAYAISPYLALWDIDRAMKGNNPARLVPHVDWTSLTHSLKEQFKPPAPASDDELPDFGSSFADNAISNAIDTELSPGTLMTTAHQLMPAGGAVSSGGGWPVWGGLHAHFVSLSKFEAQVDQPGQTPFVLHMKFEHWGWKITRFELPQSAPRS
ncbi:hypothetical protein BAR24_12345 [Gluconobacter oxydans]|uniref:DUF2939 domain-containing protein n=1 Tax=Gluconobacter thailandicus TaxID=257438 RepID=UPI00029997CE|nr:DUF2939 domain-containing protein [Gluconobacter thailandicus]AFW02303.1 hypothetical protein B932_2756 [Gluconobacter oxydans H24]ANQ42173.1 hypothetical protein BAR24_12345 [Gluconobacter oxydans]